VLLAKLPAGLPQALAVSHDLGQGNLAAATPAHPSKFASFLPTSSFAAASVKTWSQDTDYVTLLARQLMMWRVVRVHRSLQVRHHHLNHPACVGALVERQQTASHAICVSQTPDPSDQIRHAALADTSMIQTPEGVIKHIVDASRNGVALRLEIPPH
jgi:hypothetical protein